MKASGVLLHITSLPSNYGVGTLAEVDKFIKFLKISKQSYWQILPVTPTDYVNSPYASPSAFAGNILLINVEELVEDGLISEELLNSCRNGRGNDYVYAAQCKDILLREAFKNFIKRNPTKEYLEFCDENAHWLNDYALFCALKKHFGGQSWMDWPDEDIRMRKRSAMIRYADELTDEVDYNIYCQYVFFSQWKKLRTKLYQNDIKLIGDIPMYVAYDSADVWAHHDLFELTSDRRPSWVAGVPPDYFSRDGQLWGNPVYNWEAMKLQKYKWWTDRVAQCAKLFDVLRIDHFRAFDSYYTIRYGETTARVGRWRKGVGYEFVNHIQKAFPNLTIVAEDLGDIPKSVLELRDQCGLAGMKILQFAFDGNPKNPFLPQNVNEHCVAYLGTHDNDTTQGWWNSLSVAQRDTVLRMTGIESYQSISQKMVEVLLGCDAELAIVSMQDIAGDDSSCRMNTPGTTGCWKYMAKRGDFSMANARWLAKVTEDSGRA